MERHVDHLPARSWLFAIIGLLGFLSAMAVLQEPPQSSVLAAERPKGAFSVQAQAATDTITPTPNPAVTKVVIAVNNTPVAQRTPGATISSVGGLRPGDTVTFSVTGNLSGGTSSGPIVDFLNANFAVLSTTPACTNYGPVGA